MVYYHILVLHTDDTSFYKTKYVLDLILALRDSGFKVYLLTTACTVKHINDVPIKIICSWIPRSIFGFFPRELWNLRSIILTIYACAFPPKGEPTFVICDGSVLTIPLLKYFKFTVTFINYMISFENLITKISDIKLTPVKLNLLRIANAVIVPSRQCKLMLKRSKCDNVLVLSPCCDGNLHPYLPHAPFRLKMLVGVKFLFCVFGEFTQESNFYLVLDAINELKVMLQKHLFDRTKIIFMGKCNTEQECQARIIMMRIIESDYLKIKNRIIMYDLSDLKVVRTVLKNSRALIDTTESTLFNIMILRAQSIGTPVICYNSGYSNEVVKHETTGVFITKTATALRNCIHRFITQSTWVKNMKNNIHDYFKDKFSIRVYRQCVNGIIIKDMVERINPITSELDLCKPSTSSFVLSVDPIK